MTDAQPRVASLSPASGRYPQPAEAPLDDESLPRDNGDLVFDAPWQARALAIAVALVDRLDLPWDAFRHRLMAKIAETRNAPLTRAGARRLNRS